MAITCGLSDFNFFPKVEMFGLYLNYECDGTFGGNGSLSLGIQTSKGENIYFARLSANEMGRIIGQAVYEGGKVIEYDPVKAVGHGHQDQGFFHEVSIVPEYTDGDVPRFRYEASGYL